jgi:hypothetical protein
VKKSASPRRARLRSARATATSDGPEMVIVPG